MTQSIERFNCVPTELGINLAPPLCGKMRATLAPRGTRTVRCNRQRCCGNTEYKKLKLFRCSPLCRWYLKSGAQRRPPDFIQAYHSHRGTATKSLNLFSLRV